MDVVVGRVVVGCVVVVVGRVVVVVVVGRVVFVVDVVDDSFYLVGGGVL